MKQSNITYKDTYHFNQIGERDQEDSPSIYHDPKINTSINQNPYRQNVEIEKDEIVLKPDLSAMHKAGGKKHSQGGTGVYLEPDSFVFSDDKTLAVSGKEKELFELKEGGKPGPKYNTPARVLQKNVDIKHYNKMTTILTDPTKDKVAKDTAMLMLQKYMATIGNVAYIQEAKKGLPQGVPEFAMGTAPVYDPALKDELTEQKQYMKYGGTTNNPYLPQMQSGGKYPAWLKAWRTPKTPAGKISSTGRETTYPKTDAELQSDYDYWTAKAGRSFADATDYQRFLYDYHLQHNPNSVADMWSTFGQTNGAGDKPLINSKNAWTTKRADANGFLPDLDFLGSEAVRNNFLDKPGNPYLGARTMYLAGQHDQPTPGGFTPRPLTTIPGVPSSTPEDDPELIPGNVNPRTQNGVPVNWKFTPWQKQSQLYNLSKWAMAEREMPYRSHYDATYVDPALVNPEQVVGDMKAAAYQQMKGADLYSPILAQAQKAEAYGQFLNREPGVRSQYDNQNAETLNRARFYNNQVKNDETLKNLSFDQQYYREAATGRTNFRNMRGYLMDQFMNNRMQDVQDNQSLAYNMLTLGPKPAYGFDWDTGDFYRNDKNLLDVQTDSRQDIMQEYLKNIDFTKLSNKEKIDYINVLAKRDALKYIRPTPGMKKGGSARNPYKK